MMQPPIKMLASGIMMQLDFPAIRYEELCDTNPSKSQPVGGKLIEQLDPLGSIFLNGVELP
jgi:hypothetical protein